jgi:xanthine/CO dehydrogenase XdhC/CoxF family maturation factor
MTSGLSELITYDTTSENDLVWGVGLGCHGVVRVLLEKLPPSPAWAVSLNENINADRQTELAVVWSSADVASLGTRLDWECPPGAGIDGGVFRDMILPPVRLVIFGAGDDAIPLCRLAKELGWHVTVADPRREFVTSVRFPAADKRVIGPASSLVREAEVTADTLAVVMTHHYVHDVPVLRDLLVCSKRYIGLLGPRKRAEKIISDLAADGMAVSAGQRARLHAPVGLDLGAETPQEVALSILAEIQAYLTDRNGRPLRERTRPIHERLGAEEYTTRSAV